MTVIDVGFGITHDPDDPEDTKHEMTSTIYAYCPANAPQSKHCGEHIPVLDNDNGEMLLYTRVLDSGFMYTMMGHGAHSSTCSGDSGGPTYLWRDGIPFEIGVHSHVSSYACDVDSFNGNTLVSDNYDFIRNIVTDLPDDVPETNCSDGIDDNKDGRMDCEDPWCFHVPVCLPEVCDDRIDNNGDGATDCEDASCSGQIVCQPEICDDKIDNNGDGIVDCDDIHCVDKPVCQAEICNDKIDNNGDNKVDCDDPACAEAVNCQPEICDDKKDNNGDGYIDCGDPMCAENDVCKSEICDCSDITCNHASCIEICDDKIDNNGDDKVDCDDPACADDAACKGEICDDKIDNNGDNKVDCEDPLCADRYVCNPFTAPEPIAPDTDGGCSVLVHRGSHSYLWALCLGLLAMLGITRRRSRT